VATPSLRTSADAISNARDSLDGTSDLDQGISPTGTGATAMSNIVPLDANGLAFSRTTGQVLNIVYLNKMAVGMGGFFPAGVNGSIKTSAAN
jgi:predicted component of type VI protein secretion system